MPTRALGAEAILPLDGDPGWRGWIRLHPLQLNNRNPLMSGSGADGFLGTKDVTSRVTATATEGETNSEHSTFTQREAISCSVTGGNEI